jgi:putative membrane protein
MNRYFITAIAASSLFASGAVAQQQGSHNPAIKDGRPHVVSGPAHGANSFTQNQARGRLTKAGYSRVSKLSKDRNGVWRGMAYRGRSHVRVGVDYKGNVVR